MIDYILSETLQTIEKLEPKYHISSRDISTWRLYLPYIIILNGGISNVSSSSVEPY